MLSTKGVKTYRVDKVAAARRQLDTAIQLWFAEGDMVSVCALAFAAYEILHTLSTGKRRTQLLFDSKVIKDEYRNEWCMWIKKHGSFFKHANRDPDGVLEFNPVISEMLILFSIQGLAEIGKKLNDYEAGFNHWQCFQNPKLIADPEFKRFVESIPIEQLRRVQSLKKSEFLIDFMDARRQARKRVV